jgi:hypothetical protein
MSAMVALYFSATTARLTFKAGVGSSPWIDRSSGRMRKDGQTPLWKPLRWRRLSQTALLRGDQGVGRSSWRAFQPMRRGPPRRSAGSTGRSGRVVCIPIMQPPSVPLINSAGESLWVSGGWVRTSSGTGNPVPPRNGPLLRRGAQQSQIWVRLSACEPPDEHESTCTACGSSHQGGDDLHSVHG